MNIVDILKKKHSILNNIDISISIESYPKDYKFSETDSSIAPYAMVNVRNPKGKMRDIQYSYEIVAYNNAFETFGGYVEKYSNEDVMDFFKYIGVEFNNLSLMTFSAIHEVGHVVLFEKFKKETASYDNLDKLERLNNDLIGLIFKHKSGNKREFNRITNNYHFQELHSEKFAFSNFPYVWSQLNRTQGE